MDVRAIIDGVGGYRTVAANLCQKAQTVHNWIQRDAIPPEFWPQIVEMAGRVDDEALRALDLAALTKMRQRGSKRMSATRSA